MELHQLLRNLCSNMDWKYAVLWKLKHHPKMILMSEDVYCDSHENYERTDEQFSENTMPQLHGPIFSTDLLGLAVAKMSCHMYSLGEGIVGQVAVTGEYRWISADDHATNSRFFFETSDEWECQFSAGVKTVVVVPIVPIGVIQLGSLNRVDEDINFVSYIKNIFLSLRDYTADHGPDPVYFSTRSSLSAPATSVNNLGLQNVPDQLHAMKNETSRLFSPFPCLKENQMPSDTHKNSVEAQEMYSELDGDQRSSLVQSTSDNMHLGCRKFSGGLNLLISRSDKIVFDSICSPQDNNFESHELNRMVFNPSRTANFPQHSGANSLSNTKLEPESEACDRGISRTLFGFPADCELHEALGPAFPKRWNYFNHEVKENQKVELPKLADGKSSSSRLKSESSMKHLFEATIANVCPIHSDVNEVSFDTSIQTSLASAENAEGVRSNLGTITSESCSLDQQTITKEDMRVCLNSSRIDDLMSPKGFSSMCDSTYTEQFERIRSPVNTKKKHSRLGGSHRPKPRERQLIQDRIKQLRKLVPNGAKCSIESLLERTIKHTLLLQNITNNNANKLNQSDDMEIKNLQLHDWKTGFLGAKHQEQSSSWAMEVGGRLKVHSILVKNLNEKGKMFLEMLCEECSQFLEIVQAIQSLDLKILGSSTRAHDEKNWICFVVEGQSNPRIHRLDILWSLVQILQSKSAMQQ